MSEKEKYVFIGIVVLIILFLAGKSIIPAQIDKIRLVPQQQADLQAANVSNDYLGAQANALGNANAYNARYANDLAYQNFMLQQNAGINQAYADAMYRQNGAIANGFQTLY